MKKTMIMAGVISLFATFGMAATTDNAYATLSSTSAALGSAITVTVDQFDSSLGTLTGVTFLIQGSESVSWSWTANATVSLNNGLLTLNDGVNSTAVSLLYNKDVTASGSNPKTLTTFVTSNNPGTDFFGGLNRYVGTGTFDLALVYSGTWNTTSGTLSNEMGNNTLVSYYYTYVPEPTSLGLLAFGVMALGLRRRFKKTA